MPRQISIVSQRANTRRSGAILPRGSDNPRDADQSDLRAVYFCPYIACETTRNRHGASGP